MGVGEIVAPGISDDHRRRATDVPALGLSAFDRVVDLLSSARSTFAGLLVLDSGC